MNSINSMVDVSSELISVKNSKRKIVHSLSQNQSKDSPSQMNFSFDSCVMPFRCYCFWTECQLMFSSWRIERCWQSLRYFLLLCRSYRWVFVRSFRLSRCVRGSPTRDCDRFPDDGQLRDARLRGHRVNPSASANANGNENVRL